MSVIVYTTPTCGFCYQVKTYLNQRSVPFVERDVSRDPQAAAEMVSISGQQGVPVVLIDSQVVLGYNQPMIDQLLAQRATHSPKLGVAIADAGRIAAKKGTQLPDGAYVGRVNRASSASLAGLRVGDVIVQLAGQPIRSDEDVHRAMAGLRYDQDVEVLLWRDGQRMGTRLRL
jgi:glutaredoxin 3